MQKNIVRGKQIGVIGMARSGIAAANLAAANGARVLVSEAKSRAESAKALRGLRAGIETEFGGHSDRLLASDIVIKSPGVHHAKILTDIHRRGIPVWSEIELALRLLGHRCLVAITGTNGKTTTTALTGEIFKAARRQTVVAGNIGSPLASLARSVNARTTMVLELSSYQLEDSPTLHPDVSSILNVTPDHL
jgi:UDP-N-acetylmuramoylalanine--D-glutamate ligase